MRIASTPLVITATTRVQCKKGLSLARGPFLCVCDRDKKKSPVGLFLDVNSLFFFQGREQSLTRDDSKGDHCHGQDCSLTDHYCRFHGIFLLSENVGPPWPDYELIRAYC